MQKYFFTILFLTMAIIAQVLYAQENSFSEQTSIKVPKATKMNVETYSLIHIIKTYSDNCVTIYNYSYDENFNKIQVLIKHSNCLGAYDRRITYKLDSNNYVTEEVTDLFENGELYTSRISQFLYDSNYNVINIKHSLFKGESEEEFFTYNELNQIIEYSSLITSDWGNRSTSIVYFYNDINLPDSIEDEFYSNSDDDHGAFSRWTKTYNYDSVGNLIEYKYDSYEESGLPSYGTYSYIHYFYNSENQRIKELGKQFRYEHHELVDSTVWQYDNEYCTDNKLKYSVYSLVDENSQSMVNNLKTSYEYDSENNKVLILEELWKDGWIDNSRIKYEYDSKGNCLRGKSEAWTDSNWVLSKRKIGFTTTNDENFEFECERFEVFYSEVTEVKNGFNFPNKFNLSQNYPNPFNPTTTIKYSIPNSGFVSFKVYDILGKEVAVPVNERQEPGSYKVEFNSDKLSSGTYIYTLKTKFGSISKKMIIMK